MRFALLIIITVTTFLGCAHLPNQSIPEGYFGGEIVNPKEPIVLLYNKNGKISDTLTLDSENRFFKKLSNIEAGLYSFRHGGEYQMVIMEPGDSIMLRLNTIDFDESLVFTGNGARKNNYLLKIFLQNEKEDRRLVKYSQKEPDEFNTFINQRHSDQIADLEAFLGKKPVSPFAENILRSSIDYNNYADKEIYPFAYFGNNKLVHVKDLPSDFYGYRDTINYNNADLSEVFAYNRFLFSFFDNLALKDYYAENDFHSQFNRHEMSYNKAKLELIDSMIEEPIIKNNLLKYKTRDFISHSVDDAEIQQMLSFYKGMTTNEEDVEYMNRFVDAINDLRPGNSFPDLKLISINNQEYSIYDIVNKPSLIYFWSNNNKKHYRNSHYRVKELKKRFPDVEFISININDGPEKYWIETLEKYKFSLENEYKFKNPDMARETLALNFVYKVMVVDRNTKILHPNVNIFSDNFEESLEELLYKKSALTIVKR